MVANLDVGDWVGAEGEVVTSRRGELSIEVAALTLLTKALRPLPDLRVGVVDPETKYREREVDLIANADDKRVFDIRHRTIAALRSQLQAEGFIEVETPILQAQAGGAIARPFKTHSNALDIDLSLRIAPELYLKRLIVGGYERVFEIGKDFRNEGIDTRHSPEFTAMEAYRALGDMHDGMDLTERLIVECARQAAGKLAAGPGRRGHRPHPSVPPPPAPRPGRRAGRPAGPPEHAGRAGPGRVRRPRRAVAGGLGLREADLRDLRQGPATRHGRPGLRVRLSHRGLPAGSAHAPTIPRWPTASSW